MKRAQGMRQGFEVARVLFVGGRVCGARASLSFTQVRGVSFHASPFAAPPRIHHAPKKKAFQSRSSPSRGHTQGHHHHNMGFPRELFTEPVDEELIAPRAPALNLLTARGGLETAFQEK